MACPDRVVGYCSNTPETIAAFLAANSIGAIWSSCSPDFEYDSVFIDLIKSSQNFILSFRLHLRIKKIIVWIQKSQNLKILLILSHHL